MISVLLRPGTLACILAACLIALGGCATSSVSEKEAESTAERDEFFSRYENTFHPAQYDPSVGALEAIAEKNSVTSREIPGNSDAPPPETIQGFRIQVLATTEIDEANALKSELGSIPQIDSVYVSYDSPYYKVRVGDFPARPEANPLLKQLISAGYKDAWIVADRILRNPPIRRATPSPLPDNK